MEDAHFCCESPFCQMRLDLEKSHEKLVFIRDNWNSFKDCNRITAMSIKDLKCSLCVINIVVNAIANEELHCSNREIVRLITTQFYIQNTYEIHKLQKELKEEQEKTSNNSSI